MVSKDTLWKGIIEDLVEEFVRFFFPEFIEQINLQQGFTFLDKELEQLFPESEAQHRHADKLFRGKLVSGEDQWFLVHVEVQGYADPEFAKRMYQYFYRILDRYDQPLTSVAIYTNTNRQHHYSTYTLNFFGTELLYSFRRCMRIWGKPSCRDGIWIELLVNRS